MIETERVDGKERDIFLRFDCAFIEDDEVLGRLKLWGLNRAKTPSYLKTRIALIAQALAPYVLPEDWIAFSLNATDYIGGTRHKGPAFTYRPMCDEVRKLKKYGLIELELAKPLANRDPDPKQSRYRATQKLRDRMRGLKIFGIIHDVIRLNELIDIESNRICTKKVPGRKYKTRLTRYEDTEETMLWRSQAQRVNDFLKTVTMTWKEVAQAGTARYQTFDAEGNLETPLYIYRVFSRGDFSLYGRFHGFWQNQKKEFRASIKLNGLETCEPDYSSLHCVIAYLEKGLVPPDSAYTIEGFERKKVKAAFAILLNAMDLKGAIAAIKSDMEITEDEASVLVEAVKHKHELIADQLHSDKGVRFMKIDSDIACSVMLKLVEEQIPFLPVHDSFRIPILHKERTMDIMVQAFQERYPNYTIGVKCS